MLRQQGINQYFIGVFGRGLLGCAALTWGIVSSFGQVTGVTDVIGGNVSDFNILMKGNDYLDDVRGDQQTGQWADDMVGMATSNPGFMMQLATETYTLAAAIGGVATIDVQYMVMRTRLNVYDAGGYESNSKMRFGIDADGDDGVDLYFGFDGSQSGPPTVGLQDACTGLNTSPSTSTIGNNFTPTFETDDGLAAPGVNWSDLSATDITNLMTLVDGTTYDYRQATSSNTNDAGTTANGFQEFATKKANTPDADAYVTFAIPLMILAEALEEASILAGDATTIDFDVNSLIRLVAFTATNNNAINQDLFGTDGIDNNVTFASGGFSDLSTVAGVVPEPATFLQVGTLVFVGLFVRRGHGRRSRSRAA